MPPATWLERRSRGAWRGGERKFLPLKSLSVVDAFLDGRPRFVDRRGDRVALLVDRLRPLDVDELGRVELAERSPDLCLGVRKGTGEVCCRAEFRLVVDALVRGDGRIRHLLEVEIGVERSLTVTLDVVPGLAAHVVGADLFPVSAEFTRQLLLVLRKVEDADDLRRIRSADRFDDEVADLELGVLRLHGIQRVRDDRVGGLDRGVALLGIQRLEVISEALSPTRLFWCDRNGSVSHRPDASSERRSRPDLRVQAVERVILLAFRCVQPLVDELYDLIGNVVRRA